MISVVIPTLNAAQALSAALDALAGPDGPVAEIVVSDGGSSDATVALAAGRGCRVIQGARGRGAQLARGAERATQPWLLFLHADTRLQPGWRAAVADFTGAPRADLRAAVFQFALDDRSRAARVLEGMVRLRLRVFALPYGDQGLLISRRLYAAIGGFRELLLMEDVDIARRLGRGRMHVLPCAAVTSAVRYTRGGYLRRSLRNVACLALYFGGASQRTLARLYG